MSFFSKVLNPLNSLNPKKAVKTGVKALNPANMVGGNKAPANKPGTGGSKLNAPTIPKTKNFADGGFNTGVVGPRPTPRLDAMKANMGNRATPRLDAMKARMQARPPVMGGGMDGGMGAGIPPRAMPPRAMPPVAPPMAGRRPFNDIPPPTEGPRRPMGGNNMYSNGGKVKKDGEKFTSKKAEKRHEKNEPMKERMKEYGKPTKGKMMCNGGTVVPPNPKPRQR